MEAVEAMKEGKKVKSKKLNVPYLQLRGIGICNHEGDWYYTDIEQFEATDWEIVEEKKTLSDKIIKIITPSTNQVILSVPLEGAQAAMKEFFECFGSEYVDIKLAKKEAKRIFGEELIT